MGDELTWFPDVVSADPSTGPSIAKILTPATIKAAGPLADEARRADDGQEGGLQDFLAQQPKH